MSSFDRMSMRRWMRPAAIGAVGALALAIVTAAVAGGVGGIGPLDVLRRTPTPITFNTPTITPEPEPEDTPTDTPTNTPDPTPEDTATPFPTKDADDLGNAVMIGGSTGSGFLGTSSSAYVPMFDGGFGASFNQVGHVMFPGAITHLTVNLSRSVSESTPYEFRIVVSGKKSSVTCEIPSKGKGDFCEAGDKTGGDCVEVNEQDTVAVQVVYVNEAGQPAGGPSTNQPRMSWAAKLELYGSCPAPSIGQNSCQGPSSCLGNSGRIGDNSCNGPGSCQNNSGTIGKASCRGISDCFLNIGSIGNSSCNGQLLAGEPPGGEAATSGPVSCGLNSGAIGNNSCNGFGNCLFNAGTIGNNQCNGFFVCTD